MLSKTTPSALLVIGPSWVGDMVMAQPMIAQLKVHFPGAKVHLLAPEWSEQLAPRMPGVDHVITMPFGHGVLDLRGRYRFARTLMVERFQQAWVLANSFKSALIPIFAKIPKRTGWLGEWRYGVLNDVRYLDPKRLPRLVDRYFRLSFEAREVVIPPTPAPVLKTKPEDSQAALFHFGLKVDAPILALCPGAEFGASKRWPAASYAQVAQHYLKKGWQVWIFGSKNDRPVAADIQTLCKEKCIDLTGRTTLAQAIDLMAQVTRVLTNDSGLMHIASSLTKPLVAVYGSTDPGYTPPLGAHGSIVRNLQPCSPCFERECPLGHHRCMQALRPELVLDQLEQKSI